jgi:hypothetical protein
MDTDALFFHQSCYQEIMVFNRNRKCRKMLSFILGMEEMPDFPIFKVPVCNVLKTKGNRKKSNKAFEGLKEYINE